VKRRIREIIVTLAVMVVLFGLLITVNPQVRERMDQVTGEVQNQNWQSANGPVRKLVHVAVSTTSHYASDNPVLFPFVGVAVVLFVLMLRT